MARALALGLFSPLVLQTRDGVPIYLSVVAVIETR